MHWNAFGFAIALGMLVFLLWIALTHSGGSADADSGAALAVCPPMEPPYGYSSEWQEVSLRFQSQKNLRFVVT